MQNQIENIFSGFFDLVSGKILFAIKQYAEESCFSPSVSLDKLELSVMGR